MRISSSRRHTRPIVRLSFPMQQGCFGLTVLFLCAGCGSVDPLRAHPDYLLEKGDVESLRIQAENSGSSSTIEALATLAKQDTPGAREALVGLLESLHSTLNRESYTSASANRRGRELVAELLVELGDQQAVVPIVTHLMPDEPLPPKPGSMVFSFSGGKTFMMNLMPNFNTEAVNALTRAMQAASGEERGYYAIALGMMGEQAETAVPAIIEAFPSQPVRPVAIEFTGDWPGEAAAAERFGPGEAAQVKYTQAGPDQEAREIMVHYWSIEAPAAAAALYGITGEFRGPNRADWL